MSHLKICIIGSGVVGQATGKGLLSKGYDVTFIDIDPVRIKKLGEEGYKACLISQFTNGQFNFDVSFLTVPTPTENSKVNLEYLRNASKFLGERLYTLNKYHLVVVKSTVPPGTCENLVIKTIRKFSSKKAGRDFGICMNPEYLREKNAYDDFIRSWIIVIGEYDEKSGNLLHSIYKDFDCPKIIVSLKEAEIQKYIHNLFNAVKITFFNEMRQVCQKLDIAADQVFSLVAQSAEGMWNPNYGTKNMGPFNGMCLPKDTQAFLSWVKDKGVEMPLLAATIQVNKSLKDITRKEPALDLGESDVTRADYVS